MSEQLEQRREALRLKEGEYLQVKSYLAAFNAPIMLEEVIDTLEEFGGGQDPHIAVYVVGKLQGQLQRFLTARRIAEGYEREKKLITDMERKENDLREQFTRGE
jgi:hypothetical protein